MKIKPISKTTKLFKDLFYEVIDNNNNTINRNFKYLIEEQKDKLAEDRNSFLYACGDFCPLERGTKRVIKVLRALKALKEIEGFLLSSHNEQRLLEFIDELALSYTKIVTKTGENRGILKNHFDNNLKEIHELKHLIYE